MNIQYLLVITIVMTMSVIAQESKNSVEPTSKFVDRVIDREGWTCPDVKSMTFVRETSTEIDGELVVLNWYRPLNLRVDQGFYYLKDDGTVIVNTMLLEATQMVTYTAKGKTFAFGLRAAPVIASEGVRILAGALVERYFVDEDGDGIFESMYQNARVKRELPKWVRDPINARPMPGKEK